MRRFTCILTSLILTVSAVHAADAPPRIKAEDLFPDSTLAAVIIPDLAAARVSAGKTRLAEMYAQPEMQAFLAPALSQIKTAYSELRTKNALLPSFDDIDTGLFGSEVAVALYARPGDPNLPAGIVATLAPKDPEAFRRLLPQNVRDILVDGQVVPFGGGARDGAITFNSGHVILVIPQSDIGLVLTRLKKPEARAKNALTTTPGYSAVHAKLSDSVAWVYLAPQKCFELAMSDPQARRAADPALVLAMLNASGLSKINGVGFGVGFSATDPICEAYASFSVPPKNDLFALFNTETPLTADGLKIAAPESPYVAGAYVNFSGLLPFAQAMAGGKPDIKAAFAQLQALSRQVLGFDLQTDLFENLGSEVVVAQTAVDTGAPLSFAPGLTMSIPLKDPAKVEYCIKRLGGVIDRAGEGLEGPEKFARLRLKRLEFHGKPIYYLTGQLLAGPLALTISGKRLLVCTSYNAARRGLEQLESDSDILSNKNFQETITRISGKPFDAKSLPASFGYSIDRGSGTGVLLLAGLGLSAATATLGAVAELPVIPADAATANGINIAENEKAAMQACKSFVEAEEIYHRTDYTGNGVLKFAPSLNGDASLYENKAGSGDLALIDKTMAEAEGEPGGKTARQGYRFKVLKGQGAHAVGGRKSYIEDGNMTGGYALVAYPVEYGVSGKQTFVINNSGVTFTRDLGAQTDAAVKALTEFDPDPSWVEADDTAAPRGHAGNEFEQFLQRPAGKTVMSIVNSIDLGLWPDEGFFMKYRRPTGAVAIMTPAGIYWRTELPPPGPSSPLGINPALIVSASVVVAAITIPNLLRSRMAANEAAAAAACKAIVSAQDAYRIQFNKYAPTLHDLLETKPGANDVALLDPALVAAEATAQDPAPKAGYLFKVLTAQGPAANGGQKNYVVNGEMTLGFAVVAYPADYDSGGRLTYLVGANGDIYVKDFGAETRVLVSKMTEYNPDESWVISRD